MFLGATLLWVAGLVTIVPYGTYYLLFHAERDQYALLITLVLFWIFGYWGVVGPVLGACLVVALENKVGDLGAWLKGLTGIEWFGTLGESVTIVTGLIFVICVLAFRRGIVGEIGAWWSARRRQSERGVA